VATTGPVLARTLVPPTPPPVSRTVVPVRSPAPAAAPGSATTGSATTGSATTAAATTATATAAPATTASTAAASAPAATTAAATTTAATTSGSGSDSRNPVTRNLHDAWQLAFVVVADADLATKAVTKAFIDTTYADVASSVPSRLELLATTVRISLTRAAESPDRESSSAVTTALWQLPAEQRAALWLARVNELDSPSLGVVLGLTSINAGHVATRAAEWLDVALDHESGPLCPEEVRLGDFVSGHLPGDEAKEMADHLPDCPTCRTKVRAFAELTDLKAVLVAAVPEPPAGLTAETLEHQEQNEPTNGTATLAEPPGRIPAVRPLALCCAALLIIGIIGIGLVRPGKSSSDPVVRNDPRAILPGLSTTPAGGVILGSSTNLPNGPTPTVTVTTTSVPAVTFPTIPAGGVRKSKP
jgi:hypothetical protein